MAGFVEIKKKPTYPKDHKPAMEVPKGGSSCAKCEYLKDADKRLCGNPHYQAYYGTDKIPLPIDQYCSDWFAEKKGGQD